MKNVKLVIPMSGIGKRFIDAGYDRPKPLIMVDGHPIIKYILDIFDNPDDVLFICNEKHLKETDMLDILLSLSPDAEICVVPNDGRRGPVDAVLQASEFINDDKEAIVSYCDYGTVWNYEKFLDETRRKNADGAIACYTGFHPHMLGSDNYAFVKTDGEFATNVQEKKPFTDNKMSELASNGTYYFKNGKILKKYFAKLIEVKQHINNEFYVSLVYNLLIADKLRVTTFLIDKMLQWGTPYDLEVYKSWSNYFSSDKTTTCRNPENTTLILPMAGHGMRFWKDGYETPKPLLNVGDDPMIIKAVECLPKSDSNIFISIRGHQKFNIENIIKEKISNSEVIFIDRVTEGQACTCQIAVKNVDPESPIFISSCDNAATFSSDVYQRLVDDETVDVIVWTFKNNPTSKINPNMYSWVSVDGDKVTHVSTKKFHLDDPLKSNAIIGTFFFRKAKYFSGGLMGNYLMDLRTNGEFYVDDVIAQNVKSGLNVKVFCVDNYICWGTPNDYKTYNYWLEFFKSRRCGAESP